MNNRISSPELLCPAGSADAFRAAIEGGADAIYVGGTAFNARINAKNFTPEELRESIKLAHAYGVKVYVAANTLIFDQETDGMLHTAETAYLCGADALIVADVGAAMQIKRRIPIDLHASTQMSGHNVSAAKYLSELGFTRMVCAREMSKEDLSELVKGSPIETEVFVHGALCVCHSGQCLFSSLVGGRSGNRGECAQPCRLPFKGARNEYPLSLKDLSLARHIPELCQMGVASFKIEGRMKSPEYVRDVAKVWRRLIDEGRGADSKDMTELAEIFSRGGLTDGYYTKKINSSMLGVRSESDKKSTRELAPFDKITRKIPVTLSAALRLGEPMRLTVSDGSRSITVSGAVPEAARTAPLTKETIERNLTKLGATPYFAETIDISIEGELMVPLSAINALRRSALEGLAEPNGRSEADFTDVPKSGGISEDNGSPYRSAYFHFPERIPEEARSFFDIIYVPVEKYDGRSNGVSLPPVIYDSEKKSVADMLKRAKDMGCEHILVGNIGHIEIAGESGMRLHGDFRLNAANSLTAKHFEDIFEDIILSPELNLPRLRDIRKNSPYVRAVVYGRIPLMITEKCVGKELTDCATCNGGKAILTDRRGVRFPVLRSFEHRSLIVNSVPVYMADRQAELERIRLDGGHFIFTTETQEQIAEVINAYRKRLPPKDDVRRIK